MLTSIQQRTLLSHIQSMNCAVKLGTVLATRKSLYHELSYSKHGEPIDVVSYYKQDDDASGGNKDIRNNENSQCLVEMIAAPWNPADVNTIQGRYASPYEGNDKNTFKGWNRSYGFNHQSVIGSEGWGRIRELQLNPNEKSNNPHNIKPGDFVTVGLSGMGTMRSSVWIPIAAAIPIQRGQELYDRFSQQTDGLAAVSTLFQLGGTALRMIQDFQTLNDGDIVLQNAGTSGVGLFLSQLVAALYQKRVSTISFIRRGNRTDDEFNAVVEHLKTFGKNDMVLADDDWKGNEKESMYKFLDDLQQLTGSQKLPKLAINAVGGDSASLLLKLLGSGGTLVTYGGMSMKPVTIATPHFIFKDIRAVGYWHSRWMYKNSTVVNSESVVDRRSRMIDNLVDLLLDGQICNAPTKGFELNQFQDALKFEATQTGIRKKVAFLCAAQASS